MEQEEQRAVEKTCEECHYFSRHYVALNSSFMKTECGHCKNSGAKKYWKNSIPVKACPLWEIREKLKPQRIEESLRRISENLDVLSQVLLAEARITKNDKILHELK